MLTASFLQNYPPSLARSCFAAPRATVCFVAGTTIQSHLVWPVCDGPSHRITGDTEEELRFEVHPNKAFNWCGCFVEPGLSFLFLAPVFTELWVVELTSHPWGGLRKPYRSLQIDTDSALTASLFPRAVNLLFMNCWALIYCCLTAASPSDEMIQHTATL